MTFLKKTTLWCVGMLICGLSISTQGLAAQDFVCKMEQKPIAAGLSATLQSVLESVVCINVEEFYYDAKGIPRHTFGTGSGAFVSSDGYIITNAHVVNAQCKSILVTFFNGTSVPAKFIGWDHWTDIAVIKIDPIEAQKREVTIHPLEFAQKNELQLGQVVYAVGTPYGLQRTVTRGIISNLQQIVSGVRVIEVGAQKYETDCFTTHIQTDAAINPGNSGGPLVSELGKIVGISTMGVIGAQNLSFTIPAYFARDITLALIEQGTVIRSDAGINLKSLKDRSSIKPLELDYGVLVDSVNTRGPSANAGILSGDILLNINGNPVDGRFPEMVPAIDQIIAQLPVGTQASFEVLRAGQKQIFMVTTERLESSVGELIDLPMWGVFGERVTRATARKYILASTDGLMVSSVKKTSPADLAGIEVSDIILMVNGQPISSTEKLLKEYGAYVKDPKPTRVDLLRNYHQRIIVLMK
jgi:serine protease Do